MQVAGALDGQAGAVGHRGGQGGDEAGGTAGVLTQGHPRLGQGLLIRRQQRQHVVQGRPLRAIEQGVGPLDVVIDREEIAKAAQHRALDVGFELVVAPPATDNILGLLSLAQLLVGGGKGHGALGRNGLDAAEPADDGRGPLTGNLQHLFRGLLSPGRARPAGQVAPRLVQLQE